MKPAARILFFFFGFCLFLGQQTESFAQGNGQPCPQQGSSTNMELEVQYPNQTWTSSISLKPCETVEVYETHSLGSDGNLGTNLTFTYYNGSGQNLFSQMFWGFFNGGNLFPSWQTEPFPWRGTVGPEGLPVTLEIKAGSQVGFGSGSPHYPKYQVTIVKKPRPGYNLGGNTFGNSLMVSSFPASYYGSLRPEDQGQFFKVHLEGNQALYFGGYSEGKPNVGGGFTIDIYDQSLQDLTPNNSWLHNSDYGFEVFSKTFTNPYATPLDFYIRLTTWPWSVLNFRMDLSLGPIVREKPVIFVPGISGSILIDSTNGHELWPGLLTDHNSLSLNPDDNPNQNIVATDAIRRVTASVPIYGTYEQLVYAPILDMLTQRGGFREYQVSNDPARRTVWGCDTSQRSNDPTLFVFAYDWRKSNADNALLLKEYMRCVEQFHPGMKVDIVAHSMGGLVARRYILDNPGKVDKLITVATPWVGAPKAVYALETGDAGLSPLLIWKKTLKTLTEFFPGMHELFPSRSYFDLGGRPFREIGDFNHNGKPNEIYDYSQLMNVLNARHDPRSTPGTINQTFHEYSNAAQDDWRTDQSGVKYDHIIGEQTRNKTIGQIAGRSIVICAPLLKCYPFETFKVSVIVGDGTVPKRSAARLSNSLNLNAPNSNRWYYAHAFTGQDDGQYEHTGLTQNVQVHDLILYLLGRGPEPWYNDVYDVPPTESSPPATPPPTASNTSYYLNFTGVDYVGVTDSAGHTNAKIDDTFAVPVPDVSYNALGDKSVFVAVPADQSYTFAFQNGDKPIALEVAKGAGNDASLETVKYQDLQLPAGVKAMIETTATGVNSLRYDSDNNGTYDTVVQPTATLTGTDAQDVTPPDVTFSAEVLQSSTSITLGAQDSGSGVKDIHYSLDGLNFQTYTEPLSLNPSQTPKIYVFADDNALNRSNLQTFTVPNKKALLVVGVSSPLSSADNAVKTRLEDLGYVVTLKDGATSVTADALNQHIVVISSTVAPADVNTKFRDVTSPVVTWEREIFDDLGLTGPTAGTDFGTAASQTQVAITNAGHPLAGGLSGTVNVNGMSSDFGWGLPGTSSLKIATVAGDVNKALVFGYEAGAALTGLTAPSRRVGLFMTDDTTDKFNSNGWKLFDAAVNWAGGTINNAPSVNITQPTENQFFNPNSNINITATAADTDGTISKVQFYEGSNLLGTVTASPYSFTWNNVPSGNYTLTAVATDDAGSSTTSAAVNIVVNVSSGVIAGTVTQQNGTTPIGGASIRILSGSTVISSTTTNGAGQYEAAGLDPGTYSVECTAEGYEPQTQNGVVVVNGATTSQNFLLGFALPVINSVSPTIGAVGATVTITGQNFSSTASNNQVKFNGTNATVSSSSTTSIVTTVPTGATSGRLTVTTPSGASTSAVDFFVPPSPYTGSDVQVTGRMVFGETRTVTTTSSGKVAVIVFEGTTNQRMSLKISGVSLTGGNGYLDVTIKKPNGTTLVSASYISSSAFFDTTTLPVDGSYTILVDPQGTNVGSATLTLYNVPANVTGSITPNGSPVTVTTTTPGQDAELTFTGSTGQRVSLKISGISLTGGNGYTDVYLKRPDGTTLVSSSYIWSSDFFDVQTLPSNGTYTILVNPQGTNVGSVTLTLYEVPADVTGTLVSGSPLAVTMSTPGQNAAPTFAGTAGQRVFVKVSEITTSGGNGYMDLYLKKPDGTTLASQSYISSNGYIDVQVLPVSGTYTVLLTPQTSTTGSANLTLYNVPDDATGTTVIDGSAVSTGTTIPGQLARVTFEGTQGQQAYVRITNNTMSQVTVKLLKPDGTVLTSYGAFFATNFNLSIQTLPTTGTYTVSIDPAGAITGTMNVRVTSTVAWLNSPLDFLKSFFT